MTAPGLSTGIGRGLSLWRSERIYLILAVTWAVSWGLILFDGGQVSLRSLIVPAVGLGIVAMGQAPVIIAGSIDLSVAWLITLTAMISAAVADGSSSKVPIAIAAALGTGLVVGLVNGALVAWAKVHGFIATLGMALVLNGIVSLTFADNASSSVPSSLVDSFGYGMVGPMPVSGLVFLAVTALVWWVLSHTRAGSWIYAVGGGNDIARLSGIRSHRAILIAHGISGLCAAIAGVYLAARLGTPNVEVGTNGVYDLESIAVVVLGGAALSGGRGKVGATLAGVMVFVLLDSAFNQLELDQFLKFVARGVIIIAAVASYTLRSGEEAK